MRALKRFGQHFLQAPWADKLIAAINPQPTDRFLEIGPGPGALTFRLARRVAHLTAIEIDRQMVETLRPRLPENVTLVQADFLDCDIKLLVGDHQGPPGRPAMRVAGNLPYNVSSPILFKLIELHRTVGGIADATLMLQREVADRLIAVPGTRDYGVLSILIQLHADVRQLLGLPPGAFRPAPKVHSSVVRLQFRPPAVAIPDEGAFVAMVRSMFTQRRKTLSNALRVYAESRGRPAAAALAHAGVDPTRRPETLQLTELSRLAEFFAAESGPPVL
jgi:16S rRNA (adenine1518-N6/adenine1519-N6)-dimethyltransferase